MKSKKPTSVRLAPDTKIRLRQLAKAKNVTQGKIISQAIERLLLSTKGNKQ